RRIAGCGPEGPGVLAGLGVEGDNAAAHVVLHTGPTGEHLAVAHPRRFGNPGLIGVAYGGLPHLLAGGSIDRHHATVAGADIHLAIPHRDAAILPPLIGVAPWSIEADTRIELPAEFGSHGIDGVHPVEGSAQIDHAIYDNRFRR